MPSDQGGTFISYAREDSEFGLRLAKDLRAAGLDLWLDQLDIHPGERWDESVEKALRSSASLLVVLSPTAVQSNNVMDEISFALEENKRVIPILHRACEIPFRLRRVQHIDFTAEYQGGLRRLLRSLGIEDRPTGPERQESAEAGPTPSSALPRPPLEPLLPTLGRSATAAATPVAGAATAPAAARAETAEPEVKVTAPLEKGHDRLPAALVGAGAGAVLGIILLASVESRLDFGEVVVGLFFGGAAGSLIGAICGKSRERLVAALVGAGAGAVLTVILLASVESRLDFQTVVVGLLFGGAAGSLIGAIWSIRKGAGSAASQ